MKKQKPAVKAFTLIELVIVVAIIAILVTAVVQGSLMINASRISGAKSFTSKSPVPNIDGLIAWYETSGADSIKSGQNYDGARTSEWRDISPNSLVTQRNKLTRTASSAVTYVAEGINKIPSIKFSGGANIVLSGFYQGTFPQYTIFVVFSPLAAPSATAQTILDSGATNTSSIAIKNNTVALNAGSTVETGTGTTTAAFYINNPYIVAVYFNNTSSQVFVNDVTAQTGSGYLSPGTNQLTGLTIGTARGGSIGGLNGLISEIIIYNRPLKFAERHDVFKYLSEKYKIAVTNL